MDSAQWKGISENAKDLIRKLLTKDPKKRINALEALNHSWFEEIKTTVKCSKSCLYDQLSKYNKEKAFKKAILSTCVKFVKDKDLFE